MLSVSEEYSEDVSDVVETKSIAEFLGSDLPVFIYLLPREVNSSVAILDVEALTSVVKTFAKFLGFKALTLEET